MARLQNHTAPPSTGRASSPNKPSRSQLQTRLPPPLSPHLARRRPRPTCGDGISTQGVNLREPDRSGTAEARAAPQQPRDAPLSAAGRTSAPRPGPARRRRAAGGARAAALLPPGPWRRPRSRLTRDESFRSGPRFTPAPPPDKGSIKPSPEHPRSRESGTPRHSSPADLAPPPQPELISGLYPTAAGGMRLAENGPLRSGAPGS
ncbi:PREDICTED: basic salivary proline-rich protein 1-like [Sturnus vulgaris]|uniref:basic salivary proline-rich protein 1-like n=1 Tax=Sturnus vulgaris TaxID=9172 RepID=UPI000719EF23|nr:PREDICTED: basic salivary proline-rich protein 1-like [Sturnus vulgaris]